MSNRMKEEEKNEKIIRGLLKLPANKRCINCNSLGPQYVCTTFWSFICTNCSGLHREFTHRVKSISMAKFTSQEVNSLQGGGNERAREIYFKEWDSQKHSYPDSSHLDRLRDFIKHVYVERRYAGGKNIVEPPRVKGERDDYDENRSFKTYRSGSRSPPYIDPYEKHFGERLGSARNDDRNSRFNYESRSPGYDKGDDKSPNRFEMRDEITRDDKAGNDVQSPKSYKSRTSEELPKPGVSEDQKNVYISSPPMVRPVRDILGSDIPPLRVGELPKTNGRKASNSPSETQVYSSSLSLIFQSSTSSKGPNNGNSVELKRVNSGSLIDFSADSESPTSGAVNEFVPLQTDSTPANGGCWASFDISSQQKAPEAASTAGDLQSVFAQLFVNAPTPAVSPPFLPAASTNSLPLSNNSGQWPAAQQQPSSFQVSNHSTNPTVNAPVTTPLVGPFPSAVQGAMAVLDSQSSHTVMHLSHQRTVFGNSQDSLEVEGSGRKELPADLFTGVYSTSSASYPAWRMGPHHGMVYRMQYPVMMQPTPYSTVKQSAPTFHTSFSTNPFDLGNESASAPNPVINPSATLQAVASNNQLSLTNSSNFAVVPLQWMPPQQFPYPLSAFPGPYMMQQMPHDMPRQPSSKFFPAVNQGVVSEAIPSGVSISGQPPAQTNSSVQSTEGNPFG